MPRSSHYRSKALSVGRVREAIAAHDYAKALARPLNVTVDIHWAWTRVAKEGVWKRRKAVAAFLESQRHWLAYHGVGFFSILVREAPPSSTKGEHAHQLIHIPPRLQGAFMRHARDFLRGKHRHQKKSLDWDTTYNDGKLAYILKGCTAQAHDLLAAMFKSEYERNKFIERTEGSTIQGTIYGKRLFISQSLGPKARAANQSSSHQSRPQKAMISTNKAACKNGALVA